MSVVAISWDQSENRLASPMPSTVRFNQRMSAWLFLRSGVEEGAVNSEKGTWRNWESADRTSAKSIS